MHRGKASPGTALAAGYGFLSADIFSEHHIGLPSRSLVCQLNSPLCLCFLECLLSGQQVAKLGLHTLQGDLQHVQWFPVTSVPRPQESRLRHQWDPWKADPHLP